MDNLNELLATKQVEKIDYVYTKGIQARIDELDNSISKLALLYADKIASSSTEMEALRLRTEYWIHVEPFVKEKQALIERSVPKVVIVTSDR